MLACMAGSARPTKRMRLSSVAWHLVSHSRNFRSRFVLSPVQYQRLYLDCTWGLIMHGAKQSCSSQHVKGAGPGLEEASSSCRLSRKVSLFRVTKKAGPKKSEPRSRMKASSGSASLLAELRFTRTACRATSHFRNFLLFAVMHVIGANEKQVGEVERMAITPL